MEVIYHYTTSNGLLGIIKPDKESIRMWFTDYRFLNDTTEGKEVQNVYKAVITSMKKNKEIDESQYSLLDSIGFSQKKMFTYTMREQNDDKANPSFVDADAYICCFCKSGDSLDMWRYYSKSDIGYAIGLDKYQMESETRKNASESSSRGVAEFEWYDVIYSDEEKKDYMRQQIINVLDEAEAYDYPDSFILSLLKTKIQGARFMFKHKCFEHECEHRCVLYVPKDKSKIFDKAHYKTEYRTSDGVIIPYIPVNFKLKVVRSITLSPVAPNYAVEGTQSFVTQIPYSIQVQRSDLPIRY